MKLAKLVGLFSGMLLIIGTFLPMVHVPIVGNWSYWDLHKYLASFVFMMGVLAIIAVFRKRQTLLRFYGILGLLTLALTYVGARLKIADSFSFIPFPKIADAAGSLIKYQWQGWTIMIFACVVMFLAGRMNKTPEVINPIQGA